MPPRININYSIKLEALATETERLFAAFLGEIEMAAEQYRMPSEILSAETLKEIGELKDLVKDLNYRLIDIEGIVKSYLRYISEESPPPFADATSVYEKIDELTKKFGMEKNEHEVPD
mgnify:FL=1|tara:strand:- start:2198 stop:2551 length:354 start_codon:yes stop_codon:yes gene_type:complete